MLIVVSFMDSESKFLLRYFIANLITLGRLTTRTILTDSKIRIVCNFSPMQLNYLVTLSYLHAWGNISKLFDLGAYKFKWETFIRSELHAGHMSTYSSPALKSSSASFIARPLSQTVSRKFRKIAPSTRLKTPLHSLFIGSSRVFLVTGI